MERMKQGTYLEVPAAQDELDGVVGFIAGFLRQNGFDEKSASQMCIAAEEIFVNICRYAYAAETGAVRIDVFMESQDRAAVRFSDCGQPFDPLAVPPPDVALSAGQRKEGGLGVFMAQKLVSCVNYQYREGRNVLTLIKQKQTEADQDGNQSE